MASSLGLRLERLRKAGRMNSAGIQVFYGAYELETCLSELRPNVGDVVFAAKFELTRSLCVLDLSGFHKPLRRLDLFAKDQVQLRAQWQFMVQFEREITQPISPNDEYLDYIPPQAVAEYLVNNHAVEVDGEEEADRSDHLSLRPASPRQEYRAVWRWGIRSAYSMPIA